MTIPKPRPRTNMNATIIASLLAVSSVESR